MLRILLVLGLLALIALLLYFLLLMGIARRPGFVATRTWECVGRLLGGAGVAGLLLIIASLLLPLVLPQRAGPLALLQVFAPYLTLLALLVVPLALVYRSRLLRILLMACTAIALLRCPPALTFPVAEQSEGKRLTVFHWNVLNDGPERQERRLRPLLVARPADVVVLAEAYWDWMRRDPVITSRYPYQYVHTEQAASGLVVLSAIPVLHSGVVENPPGVRGWPRVVWIRLDLGVDRQCSLWRRIQNPRTPRTGCVHCSRVMTRASVIT